jgi:modification target Cys-rich repeat protein
MTIPGFTADSSIYKSCQVYHGAGSMCEFLNRVVPQQTCDFDCLGSCYSDCVEACDDPSSPLRQTFHRMQSNVY